MSWRAPVISMVMRVAMVLAACGALAGARQAGAQEGTLAIGDYIRTVCAGNERCEAQGRQFVQDGKGLVVTLAAMCQEIPRSKEEGECFQTGYGLASVLRTEDLQPTMDALVTTREKLVRFLTSVHDDCGKRSQCYWIRLMGFEREYKVYQEAEGK